MRGVFRAVRVLVLLALVLAGVVLTVARLVEPPGMRWVQVEAFTPLAMPVYLVVLLVACVWVFRARGATRLLPAMLLVVSAVGLGAHVSWFLPQVNGANPPPAEGGQRLTVMTANLHEGEGDGLALVEEAAARDVDLLVVQEVTPAALRTMEAGGLADLLPHRVGEPDTGTLGTMAFSRQEISDSERLDTTMGSYAFSMAVGTEELVVAAVHPAPPLSSAWEEEHAAIAGWLDDHEADLVVGDFNATADHRPMRHLAGAGYRTVTDLANEGWRPTWNTSWLLPVVQIDHVLCGPRMAGISSQTVAIDSTDHRALVAEVGTK